MKPTVLKQNGDFHRLYSHGKYVVGKYLITYCLKTKRDYLRYGITSGKKIGNAVTRNRCRRLIREAFRVHSFDISGGYDFVFVARVATGNAKMSDVLGDMSKHLSVLGVIKNR